MDNNDAELTKDQIHEALSNTSVDLHYVFWNIPRSVQIHRPSPDDWSPLEILIHLRQVGEVYASRVKRIVNLEYGDELPFLHNFDENKQMSMVDLDEETVKYNLGQFMQARSELLSKISFLEADEWDKYKCKHESHGEMTLRQLLIPLVKREEQHLDQLKELLSTAN
ncbi:MAG: DinB family protein [Candidatus Kariarchaeaceae archaeon]|jgi:hypothetical protein